MTGQDQPHILVVDDDDRLRDLLTRYLAENGFMVSAARDAAEARSSLAGLQFDLVVLDVLMPGEKGVDLARSLREGGSKLPILLLTALTETEDRISGLEAGAMIILPSRSSRANWFFGSKPFCAVTPRHQSPSQKQGVMSLKVPHGLVSLCLMPAK